MNAQLYRKVVSATLFAVIVLIGIELRQPRRVGRLSEHSSDRLTVHIGDVDFRDTRLDVVLKTLATRSGADLSADWGSLRTMLTKSPEPFRSRITADTRVTLGLHNSTLGEALDGLCASLRATRLSPVRNDIAIRVDAAGALILCSVYGPHRSETTLPRFYNVDNLTGGFRGGSAPADILLHDIRFSRESAPELRLLAIALQPFARAAEIGCFGRLLMVNGSLETQENIAALLQRMEHPIQISRAAAELPQPRPLPMVPVFSPPRRWSSVGETLKLWQAAGAGHARVDLDPEDDARFVQVMYFEYHDASLEKIAGQIVFPPLLVIPSTDRDDCVHVRRCHWERLPRIYDVSEILAHSDQWYIDPLSQAPSFPAFKADQLIRLLDENVDHDNVHFAGSAVSPVLATCWNGLLILREDPEIHARVVRFLDHLERTDRPSDSPKAR
jgi:hypothetical protein